MAATGSASRRTSRRRPGSAGPGAMTIEGHAPSTPALPVLAEMATARDEHRRLDLGQRLRAEIVARGPITFAEFMEAALYDPAEGFYARPPVGEEGHFVTSPHLSPVFGRLMARQVEEFWELLDRPSPFDVVEVGAGDGTLADQILGALPDDMSRRVRYTAVERSVATRDALAGRGVATAADLGDLQGQRVG